MYVQVVGPEPAEYAAVSWSALPDAQFPTIRRGDIFEVEDGFIDQTYPRIDMCLGDER